MADGWKVTQQTETTMRGDDNHWVEAVQIVFKTDAGTTGTVVIPRDRYGADAVRELIDGYVEKLTAVANL